MQRRPSGQLTIAAAVLAFVAGLLIGIPHAGFGVTDTAGTPTTPESRPPGPITGASAGIPYTWNNGDAGTPSGTSAGPTTGDTWYNTWADNGKIYATADDAHGFTNTCNPPGGNVIFDELTGDDPSELTGTYENCLTSFGLAGNKQNYQDGSTWKSDGVISVDGTLYVVVARQVDGKGGYPAGLQPSTNASIIKSTDHGRTWSNSFGVTNDPAGAAPQYDAALGRAQAMFPGSSFSTPVFINYGQDDDSATTADGADKYVYAISNDGFAYDGSYMILGRVLRSKIGDLNAADWQFYSGPPGGEGGEAANWSSNVHDATHVIDASHQLSQSSVQYVPSLHTYILASEYFPFTKSWPEDGFHTTWNFYESPHPWGPWTRFFNEPTAECYFSCSTKSSLGWYDPALVSKFMTMDGLGQIVLTNADFSSTSRPNDFIYKMHAFPLTLMTNHRQVIDDSDSPVTYDAVATSGAWMVHLNKYAPGYHNYTAHYSKTAGSTASYKFFGNSISWVGGKNNDHGYAAVYVDGGPPVSVNTYAEKWQRQQILFEKSGLPNGEHTITVTVTVDKDDKSSGIYQDIDAFIVGHQ